jgi:photosystem II stability/assembly factor-like uncharacterized protein
MKRASQQSRLRAGTALAVAMLALVVPAAGAAAGPAVSRSFARLPLSFEAADESAGPGVQFLARGAGHTYFLAPTGAVMQLGKPMTETAARPPLPGGRRAPGRFAIQSLQFQLLGANPQARMQGCDELAGKVNYLVGSDPRRWRSDVRTFGKVQVAEAYPGIDVIYYASEQQLEYDFHIAPGGHPETIRMQIAGADALRLDAAGNLLVSAGAEQICQHRPVAYQLDGAVRKEVAVAYRLDGADRFGFTLGDFDPALPLVIDPVLSYATYLGGPYQDTGWDVALDSSGNVYLAGETLSSTLPTTLFAFQRNYGGGTTSGGDAFVAKLDATGSNLVYLTYLGGVGDDAAFAIAADGAGNAYVTGFTDSTNFPVASAIQPQLRGKPLPFFLTLYPAEAFVAKLNPTGSALVYSTYLGGDTTDFGLDIAVDAGGNAYVTGFTDSTNFPTANALQPNKAGIANAGNYDAFVTKIASNGSAFVYSTYLGGAAVDEGQGIAVNAAGEALVTGYTQSTNFPTTNAFQSWLAGGKDAFVTVLGPYGTNLVRSTYLGGSGDDLGYRISLDAAGNAYVAGSKDSAYFPTMPSELNPGGVYRSSDAGVTWTESSQGLAAQSIYSLTHDAANPARVYAGTGRGVARSSDGGATWDVVIMAAATSVGLAPGIALNSVASVVVDPLTPATVYAAAGDGVYKSLNAGTNWSLMSTGLSYPTVNALTIDPQTPAMLYAGTSYGVFKSTNGAATWSSVFSLSGVTALAINPAAPATVYAGTPNAIYRTTDGGSNWIAFSAGLTNQFRDTLVIDPQTPATLYAGTWGGLFKTTNSGTNWTMLNLGSPFNTNITAMAINPQSPSTLYAAHASHTNGVGILKSADGGNSWQSLSNQAENGVASLAVNPLSPTLVLAGSYAATNSLGSKDVFVTKFTPTLGLAYSAIFGGYASDEAWSLAVDPAGNAYVTGITASTNFPAVNALQATNSGGNDVFVAALAASGQHLFYSTYLGGSGADYGYGIEVDAAGNAWVIGQTVAANLATAGAVQTTFAGGTGDAFVAKLAQQPLLTVRAAGGNVVLAWRAFAPEFKLESNSSVAAGAGWTAVPQVPVLSNGWHTVTLGATNSARFFRLSKS